MIALPAKERAYDTAMTRTCATVPSLGQVEAMLLRPELPHATQKAARMLVEDYEANRILNRVFNDRGRYLIGFFAHYLHHFPLEGESDAGLTAGRLRKLCVDSGVSSAGRASAMINIMRFAGYLRAEQDPKDRRRTLLVPTQRFERMRRRRWLRLFEAVAAIMPEGLLAQDLLDRPAFQIAFIRAMVDGYMKGFRFSCYAPELDPYFDLTSGYITLMHLFVMSRERAGCGSAPPSISTLASKFWNSRAQTRRVLNRAEADGFIERIAGSRAPIVVLPRLEDAMDRVLTACLIFCGNCSRAAMADTDLEPEDSALRPSA